MTKLMSPLFVVYLSHRDCLAKQHASRHRATYEIRIGNTCRAYMYKKGMCTTRACLTMQRGIGCGMFYKHQKFKAASQAEENDKIQFKRILSQRLHVLCFSIRSCGFTVSIF